MPQHIFTARYPAPNCEVRSVTYRAGWSGYGFWYIPSFVLLALLIVVWNDPSTTRSVVEVFLAGAVVWAVPVTYYFRTICLKIRPDGISYSRPFAGTRTVRFSDMGSAVIVINNASGLLTRKTGRGRDPLEWTLILTQKPPASEKKLKIPLGWFGFGAHKEIVRILDPPEWSAGADEVPF